MRKYSNADIQIFIPTYNRAPFLKESLNSVLAQSVSGFEIVVLDNSTNDETQKFINNHFCNNIKYAHTDHKVKGANFLKAQELMSRDYAIILHDDDIMHPRYIETVLNILNSIENLKIILPNPTNFSDMSFIKFKDKLENMGYLFTNKADFAGSFWTNLPGMWTGSVCRSLEYKKIDIVSLNEKYGKIGDVIMLINMIGDGKALILKDRQAVFYRHHSGQDLRNDTSRISLEQLMNYIKFYHKFYMKSGKKYLQKIYYLRSVCHIKGSYENILRNEDKRQFHTWRLFSDFLLKEGLVDKKSIFYSKRRENFLYRILTFPMKLFYKNDFFSKRLIKF
ncbi:MAG: glycosyltransferase [Endomicrobium sp.]|jgi:glycosyltransferase involved in cell wall biosynthesis|nr:glycosyltransferase [Endomicrobium sp.]